MHQEVKSGHRQDWHQTSTGVGHHIRPGYYFPDSEFKVRYDNDVDVVAPRTNISRTGIL